MNEDISFDYDDPGLLFDPKLYEPGGTYGSRKVVHSDEEEMEEQDESSSAGSPERVAMPAVEQVSSDWDSKPNSGGMVYPNLQVTQNMLRPQRIRREKSSAVDCYQ